MYIIAESNYVYVVYIYLYLFMSGQVLKLVNNFGKKNVKQKACGNLNFIIKLDKKCHSVCNLGNVS